MLSRSFDHSRRTRSRQSRKPTNHVPQILASRFLLTAQDGALLSQSPKEETDRSSNHGNRRNDASVTIGTHRQGDWVQDMGIDAWE